MVSPSYRCPAELIANSGAKESGSRAAPGPALAAVPFHVAPWSVVRANRRVNLLDTGSRSSHAAYTVPEFGSPIAHGLSSPPLGWIGFGSLYVAPKSVDLYTAMPRVPCPAGNG